jgi:RNA polymerase sigma-70 factor (ECF subfamily)
LPDGPPSFAPVGRPPAAAGLPSFQQIFRSHAAFVWRVLRRFGVAEADLEDVCQEVFLVVHRRLPEFEGRSSLRTWLYEIARRSALAHRRTRPGRREDGPDALDELAHPDLGAEQRLDRQAALRWLEQALLQLDEDKREAFVLYELEEMTLAEVSEAVGSPINTVHYRVQAARAALSRRGQASRERSADASPGMRERGTVVP